MKASELIRKLQEITARSGRDVEVRLMVDATDGACLGVSGLHNIWHGEDVTETQMLIVLSGTEGVQ